AMPISRITAGIFFELSVLGFMSIATRSVEVRHGAGMLPRLLRHSPAGETFLQVRSHRRSMCVS
ncbi:MAG: hypothetical protein ACREJC_21810, partial [Tepidisphaeraceae bacterium]